MDIMNEKRGGLTRRGFIGLGALAAAGSMVGLAGCAPQNDGSGQADAAPNDNAQAGTDWLGAEPEVTDIARTEETDFLIIGAGTAGMCAAGTAADLGLDFILC